MAEILRGKRRGETVAIHQFCNDWFTLEDGTVLAPPSLRLDPEEVRRVTEASERGETGIMFDLYVFSGGGRFARRSRPYERYEK